MAPERGRTPSRGNDAALVDAPNGPRPGASEAAASRPVDGGNAWWDERPDRSILIVGNQRGKLKPCGCSEPQLGGLERLAVLTWRARRRALEGVTALSVGWSLTDAAGPQAETKAALYRHALDVLDFDALLLGTSDLFVPALAIPYEGEGELLRPAPPGNARLSPTGALAFAADTRPIVDLDLGDLQVSALSLLDPAHLVRLSGVTMFVQGPEGSMQRLQPRPDTLWVVSTDATEAAIEDVKATMRRLGPSLIIDFGAGTGRDRVERTRLGTEPLVVTIGELGKEAGILDLNRISEAEGGGWEASFHVVPLEPSFETVDSPLRDAVTQLFETYKHAVKEREFLASVPLVPDHPLATYVGSGRCADCHADIYKEWLATPHARALITLQERGYGWDPECIRCHVVGFQRLGGGRWGRTPSAFANARRTAYLGGVGCENCHGPGSAHVEKPYDRRLFARGGPNRRDPGRKGCEVCHDVENSHAFPEHYADLYLPAVDHREVPADRRTRHDRQGD